MNLRRATRGVSDPAGFAAASLLGTLFLLLKGLEYNHKAAAGITFEAHSFFTFYYLLTGFHAAHVIAGILLLALAGLHADARMMQTGVSF